MKTLKWEGYDPDKEYSIDELISWTLAFGNENLEFKYLIS